jgi:hypothetical protein
MNTPPGCPQRVADHSVDFKKVYANLGPELQRIGSVIPAAIKSDYDTFVAAFDPFLQAIAAANYDFTKVPPTVVQALSSPQVKAAGTAIRQYITQVRKSLQQHDTGDRRTSRPKNCRRTATRPGIP